MGSLGWASQSDQSIQSDQSDGSDRWVRRKGDRGHCVKVCGAVLKGKGARVKVWRGNGNGRGERCQGLAGSAIRDGWGRAKVC